MRLSAESVPTRTVRLGKEVRLVVDTGNHTPHEDEIKGAGR